ncbi:MAG TPA: hypothetical protein VFH29_07425, partial [Anaerolineales bacterium]|nr:hypothetical protein [Anaerolineales bacterium]
GRRWDLELSEPLDFNGAWESRLRQLVGEAGRLHRPSGSDVFVFPNLPNSTVPDFAVGRAGWDNWMIFDARRRGIPVVDFTASVMMVHQNHDYSHLPGGMPHYSLPETSENIRLAGGTAAIRYTVLDATHELRNGKVVRAHSSWERLLRGIEVQLRRLLFFVPAERIEALARPKRWRKRWERLLWACGLGPRRPSS